MLPCGRLSTFRSHLAPPSSGWSKGILIDINRVARYLRHQHVFRLRETELLQKAHETIKSESKNITSIILWLDRSNESHHSFLSRGGEVNHENTPLFVSAKQTCFLHVHALLLSAMHSNSYGPFKGRSSSVRGSVQVLLSHQHSACYDYKLFI